MKLEHEFRDPIHGFIKMSSDERKVVDSWPFQRLRHIHQLAMTYLVYPGATHRRFEHSLGVMELASRVYKTITKSSYFDVLPEKVRACIPELKTDHEHWFRTLRMAALCHDLGHLPFSHANEDLLPPGYTHERMTWEIIHGPDLGPLWKSMHLDADEIGRLALGSKEMGELGLLEAHNLTTWESLLSEIIVGDAFGVDRMDYLLRDSHHLGVSYGRFDIKRVLEGLRIIYEPPQGEDPEDQSWEPTIGVEHGTLHAASELLWSRYSIFSQVYFHHVRRVFDLHLQEFMKQCYPNGYPISYEDFLMITDNEILTELHKSLHNKKNNKYTLACRLAKRTHYRCVYKQTLMDKQYFIENGMTSLPCIELSDYLKNELGMDKVLVDKGIKKQKRVDFPILYEGTSERVIMASQEMPTINTVPNIEAGYIFVDPELKQKAKFLLSIKMSKLFK